MIGFLYKLYIQKWVNHCRYMHVSALLVLASHVAGLTLLVLQKNVYGEPAPITLGLVGISLGILVEEEVSGLARPTYSPA